MGSVEALQQVENHLERGIDDVKGSRASHRKGSTLQVAALSILSAGTTLLIGLNEIYQRSFLTALALTTAVVVTVVSAWTAWFGFRRPWLASTVTLTRLWALRDQIDYDKARLDDQVPQPLIDEYHERLQSIFAEHGTGWERARPPAALTARGLDTPRP